MKNQSSLSTSKTFITTSKIPTNFSKKTSKDSPTPKMLVFGYAHLTRKFRLYNLRTKTTGFLGHSTSSTSSTTKCMSSRKWFLCTTAFHYGSTKTQARSISFFSKEYIFHSLASKDFLISKKIIDGKRSVMSPEFQSKHPSLSTALQKRMMGNTRCTLSLLRRSTTIETSYP